MSKTFRFHTSPDLSTETGTSLLRKRRRGPEKGLLLLASDASSITDTNGTRPIETYRPDQKVRPVVFTRKEADLIALANPGARPPSALEVIYPWLPIRPFLSDSEAGFERMKSIVQRYGQHFVSAATYCDQKWNTICNTLRRKSHGR